MKTLMTSSTPNRWLYTSCYSILLFTEVAYAWEIGFKFHKKLLSNFYLLTLPFSGSHAKPCKGSLQVRDLEFLGIVGPNIDNLIARFRAAPYTQDFMDLFRGPHQKIGKA